MIKLSTAKRSLRLMGESFNVKLSSTRNINMPIIPCVFKYKNKNHAELKGRKLLHKNKPSVKLQTMCQTQSMAMEHIKKKKKFQHSSIADNSKYFQPKKGFLYFSPIRFQI